MKKQNNTAIRRAWLNIGALTDAQVLEAAATLPKAEQKPKETKRVKSRKGKAKK